MSQDIARMRLQLMGGLLTALVAATPAKAVEFEFRYDDPAGTGFLDPALGPARRTALEAAGDIWGRLIRPTYDDESIIVHVKFDSYDPGSTTLASAGPHFYYSDFDTSHPRYDETNYPKALANHLSGTDLNPTRHEIDMRVNVAQVNNLYFGTDGMPANNQFDFVTIAAHELGHGLGFDATMREDGGYGVFGDGTYDIFCFDCLPTPYDQFLTLGQSGAPLVPLSSGDREDAVVSNNVFWNGGNGILANGGAPRIFAPSPYIVGSSISHLDTATFPNSLMAPSIAVGQARQTISALERGMMRDMGWTISVFSSQVSWSGLGADNNASTPANWTQALPLPGDRLLFGESAKTDVQVDLLLYSLEEINFSPTAPAYTLRFRPSTDTDLTVGGLINNSAQAQSIVLESRPGPISAGFDPGIKSDAAQMGFRNAASAGNASYEVQGGGTGYHETPNLPRVYQWSAGAQVTFHNTATAGTASFVVDGGDGDRGPNAMVTFRDNSSAGAANFQNNAGRVGIRLPLGGSLATGFGGQVRFQGNSTAGTATFLNEGEAHNLGGTGGSVVFAENATAAQATIDNRGSATTIEYAGGGRTSFLDNARAGMADITNQGATTFGGWGGVTQFLQTSTADNALIENSGGFAGGLTQFRDTATAGNATIRHMSGTFGGRTEFHSSSNAGTATIGFVGPIGFGERGGILEFRDSSSAAQATIATQPEANATVFFKNNSTAGQAAITLQDNTSTLSTLIFQDQATAGNATLSVGRVGKIDFTGSSTAGQAIIIVRPSGNTTFQGAGASAGNAQILVSGSPLPFGSGFSGGQLNFYNGSAGNATITTRGGSDSGAPAGSTYFSGSSARAGNATLIAEGGTAGGQGGFVRFDQGAKGDQARIVANAGARVDFTGNRDYGGTEVGSIEGAGNFFLRSPLTVGNLNTSTVVSGQLSDPFGFPETAIGSLTKVGTGALTLSGVNTYSGATTVAAGTLLVNGSIAGDAVIQSGATLGGTGTIGGAVSVQPGGIFSPGTSPGTITVGSLEIMAGGILEMELGDPADQIIVTGGGNVVLDGTLNVSVAAGFVPTLGQTFSLFGGAIGSITGAFDQVNLPTANGLTFDFTQSGSAVTLEPIPATLVSGDYNGNGVVDAADYTRWRDTLGSSTTLFADTTPGDVSPGDYDVWKANFGRSSGSGSSLGAVPEPGNWQLLTLGAAIASTWLAVSMHPRPARKFTVSTAG